MNITELIKQKIYFRQHPETALRYLPIVDLLTKFKLQKSKILEVGSGSYGIAPYLQRKIVGVDTDFSEPEYPLLKQVKTSAKKLPFKKDEFDVVILSDVLEHLPKDIRGESIKESLRVAKKAVIISGPFGKEAAKQDKLLAKYSKKKLKKMHPYFEDHLKFGLPEVEDIYFLLKNEKKVKNVQVVGQFFNLRVREKLMKVFITNQKLQYYFYLKGLMPIVPLLRRLNYKPCYRVLFFISMKG